MEHRLLRRRGPKSSASPATWGVVLAALVSGTVVACSTSDGGGMPDYPDGHPCNSVGACGSYVEMPDGTARPTAKDGQVPAGGKSRVCGACNG